MYPYVALVALLSLSAMPQAHAADSFADDAKSFAGGTSAEALDMMSPYREFYLERDQYGRIQSEDDGEFDSIELVSLGNTKGGSAYGSGKIHTWLPLIKKTETITWCLVSHPEIANTFIFCIQPRPYNNTDKIKRYVICTNPDNMALIGDDSRPFSYTLKRQKAHKKADLIAKRKSLASQGAFKLLASDEKNMQAVLTELARKNRVEANKPLFLTKVSNKIPGISVPVPKLRRLEVNSVYTQYSYIINFTNNSPHTKTVYAEFIMKDKEGFKVDSTLTPHQTLSGGETSSHTATWMVDSKHVDSSNTIEVVIKEW